MFKIMYYLRESKFIFQNPIMIPLFSHEQLKLAKSKTTLPLKCKFCANTFYKTKFQIQKFINPNQKGTGDFCSPECMHTSQITKFKVLCTNCQQIILRLPNQFNRSSNHFCGSSCAAIYNNKNKTSGYRRSKLEIWIEEQLTVLYPHFSINFNKKTAIGSELDIYIPSLNLAFELNGLFHYEPIYGINKLNQIQNNDISKSKACHDAKIDLCVIDTSQQKHFNSKSSQKYLDIIVNIINRRIEEI